ncbi:motility associated factor glycosyltransferase family protein [Evansella cellulosilytica]|uniref:DUF115 domain-containing protein n=1 Tax=Evansella cellulosilytica (strain ATCC 21833 / DSM 2522 / FERM P-1141 / JCM 9156 / N-4) TaxID=649639 RepID=E6TS88_EVAC2|nr:6-hydroxymethylpterin diphosphokinase MptE-like protein [Evansella cellulosilytica]ADU31857.1 protein of unknown function DUF115 [Evansella cellulosilytica DSM 2522]
MIKSNQKELKNNHKLLLDLIVKNENFLSEEPLKIGDSKTGDKTLEVDINGRPLSIHSKYNPLKEAQKVVDQYRNGIDQYNHIVFLGCGLGYHIEEFINQYPDKKYTIYEPSPAIFYQLLCTRKVDTTILSKVNNICLDFDPIYWEQLINELVHDYDSKVLLVILPSYTRAFSEQIEEFTKLYKEKIQQRGMSLTADLHFSKRWTLNSLINLPETIKSPNILMDKKEVFYGKPVIIVSAGPSLHEELENLREIKKNGTAYIIAVGSANKALIASDILPDAVSTYDPQKHNYRVFMPMLEKNIDTVPMIYGTSVGYETVEKYKGPKLHFVTTQDTVSPYYIDYGDRPIELVDDAFSIATVTFEIFAKLKADPIILVGQNLAFKDNLYYSKEIRRGKSGNAEIKEKDLTKVLTVKDVNGKDIKTNMSLNQMRLNLEEKIRIYDNVQVINTTKNGANIEGANFLYLNEVIEKYLDIKVVKRNWYTLKDSHPIEKTLHKISKMEREETSFKGLYEKVRRIIEEISNATENYSINKLENLLSKLDKSMKKLMNNNFFQFIILPISRIDYEKLQFEVKKLQTIDDITTRSRIITKEFGGYLIICKKIYNELLPEMKLNTHSKLRTLKGKYYSSDCGVFKYTRGWSTHRYSNDINRVDSKIYYNTRKNAEAISFKFSGSSIKIFAGTRNDFTSKVKVTIDNEEYIVSSKSNESTEFIFEPDFPILEVRNLEEKMHFITIELLDDNHFVFNGIEIEANARVFHIEEVTEIRDLEIGKRIRCHYKANFNKPGVFSGLGKETKLFISSQSNDYPNGDFYLIMVDKDGEKLKLISDRNVQKNISWSIDLTNQLNRYKKSDQIKETIQINLLESSEWDYYIVNSEMLELNKIPKSDWNLLPGSYFWTETLQNKGVVYRGMNYEQCNNIAFKGVTPNYEARDSAGARIKMLIIM